MQLPLSLWYSTKKSMNTYMYDLRKIKYLSPTRRATINFPCSTYSTLKQLGMSVTATRVAGDCSLSVSFWWKGDNVYDYKSQKVIFLLLGQKFPSVTLLMKPIFCVSKTKNPLLFFPPPSQTKHFPPPKNQIIDTIIVEHWACLIFTTFLVCGRCGASGICLTSEERPHLMHRHHL